MAEKAAKQGADPRRGSTRSSGKGDQAFDVWLERGLHKLYDDVAREPVPEELLRLIEAAQPDPPRD